MKELDLDISQFERAVFQLKDLYSKEEFDKLMYAVLRRTGSHVKMILKRDLKREYVVKSGDITQTIRPMKISTGADGTINCAIPIEGNRGTIGRGNALYKATGGRPGWHGIVKGKRYKITSRMVRSGSTTLPEEMAHQGGNPPFINTAAPKLNNLVFTRLTKARLPIVRVVGIGIPQMPLNRSETDVQEDIETYMFGRLEAEHNYRMSKMKVG